MCCAGVCVPWDQEDSNTSPGASGDLVHGRVTMTQTFALPTSTGFQTEDQGGSTLQPESLLQHI